MNRVPLFRWLRNISIAQKLYITIGVMSVLIMIELITLRVSIATLSSVRASVEAEGFWSKNQKDAVFSLIQYSHSGDEADFGDFKVFLEIHGGDRKAFDELKKETPDTNIMREGYLQGGIHPADLDGVVNLFLRFHSVSYLKKAIQFFYHADTLVSDLRDSANEIYAIISVSGVTATDQIDPVLTRIARLNKAFTEVEGDFSSTLSEGSRFLERLVLGIVFSIALTVEISGILLAITLSRSISRGVNEIVKTSEEIGAGNLDARATVFSEDEIGELARAFNLMINDVAQRNRELEQFAYVASHDLQEPLRTITNFVGLLEKEPEGEKAKLYMKHVLKASSRMQTLIMDLLELSRVGNDPAFSKVSCHLVMEEVVSDLKNAIEKSDAIITIDELPEVFGNELELTRLFVNIASNAIKFHKPDVAPIIRLTATENMTHYLFSITDNGIGIDEKHCEKIFVIFQRLHSVDEYHGTGIGLAICKKIAELHGGRIWAEPNSDEGCTFHFTIAKLAE
tara:strand:+ start:1254 stop:2786 length:1533 start_codon:yes stop_codon:yes gene_type:complete